MKYLFVILLSSSLTAAPVDEIESILKDVKSLRVQYTTCRESLNEKQDYKIMLEKELLKNASLQSKIDNFNKKRNNNTQYKKEMKELRNILKTKEKAIIYLNNRIIKLKTTQIKDKKTLEVVEKTQVLCKDENIFPQLVMKKTVVKKVKEKEEKINFAPSTFRLLRSVDVYDSINGNKITQWEKNRSFTSNIKTQNWIKITGYFMNKKWQASQEELWIKKENTVKK